MSMESREIQEQIIVHKSWQNAKSKVSSLQCINRFALTNTRVGINHLHLIVICECATQIMIIDIHCKYF